MGRPVDQETMAIDRVVYSSRFPRGEAPHTTQGLMGMVRRQREWEENVGPSLFRFHGRNR